MTEAPVVRVEIRGAMARLWKEWRDHNEIVLSGPAGTGKTRGILDWIHHRCSTEKNLRVLIARKTLESLKASALVTFQEQVLHDFDGKVSQRDGVSYFGGNNIRQAQFTYADTGSIIVLGGMDRPSKVLSTEYDIIYINECTELTSSQWEMLSGRTDRPSLVKKGKSLLIGDCNPSAPTHWVKLRDQDGLLTLWPTTHKDNPAMWDTRTQNWTRSGLQYLDRLRSYTGVLRLRYMLGLWAAAEGQIYEMWDDNYHVVPLDRVQARLANAWFFGTTDWGWTNPGVLQVWAVDGDRRLIRVAEVYHTKRTVDGWWVQQALNLQRQWGVREWVCDPAEPQYIQTFNANGLRARPAINAIKPGIDAVQERLAIQGDGLPRIMLLKDALSQKDPALVDAKLPTCSEEEVGLYVWATNKDGVITKERPADEYNHGMDTMRYAAAHVDLQDVVATLTRVPRHVLRRRFPGVPSFRR